MKSACARRILCYNHVVRVKFTIFCLLSCLWSSSASAALLPSVADIRTYTDFGQNNGRYATQNVNELMQHLRSSGVSIPYTTGSSFTLPHSFVDFSAVADSGNAAVVGYSFVASVQHLSNNSMGYPSFSAHQVGDEHALRYRIIEYTTTTTDNAFMLTPEIDYKVSRMNKIITDVAPAAVCNTAQVFNNVAEPIYLYSAGAGVTCEMTDAGEVLRINSWGGEFAAGHVMQLNGIGAYSENYGTADARGCTDDSYFFQASLDGWSHQEAILNDPLPAFPYQSDSGSPVFVWNSKTQRYEYLGAWQTVNEEALLAQATGAAAWTQETMRSFDKVVTLGVQGNETIFLNAAQESETTVSDATVNASTTLWHASVSGGGLDEPVKFVALKAGESTWKSLSDLRDSATWYTYNESYLNAGNNGDSLSFADLFVTENVVFRAGAADASYDIRLSGNVDTGIGYVEFCAPQAGGAASYTISSEAGSAYMLDTAGYVVGAGVDVYVKLTQSNAASMREWRKVGAGNLHLVGEGNNEIFLNLGGSGKTYLEQNNGYAAWAVLANNGSQVCLGEGNLAQIGSRFTFGNGGATLDFNGAPVWNSADSFAITALSQDAILSNSAANTTTKLIFAEAPDVPFLASFTDTPQSALQVEFLGKNKWTLRSIHTKLQHADSGLTVSAGEVELAGTLTLHAEGSSGTGTGRYTHEDDWHYADAAMNVTVKDGATFSLGSHARLVGDVLVEKGGTYIMREGVRKEQEYIEGGENLESTASISAYYGHKGDIFLQQGATLQILYSEGVTALNSYSESISGQGLVELDLGRDAIFTLNADCSAFTGFLLLKSGTVQTDSGLLASSVELLQGAALTGASQGALLGADSLTVHLNAADMSAPLTLGGDSALTLYSDSLSSLSLAVDTLYLDLHGLTNLSDLETLNILFTNGETEAVFTDLKGAYLTFNGNQNLVYSGTLLPESSGAAVSFTLIPEPATSSLFLISLSLLAHRRRRK